MRAGAAGQGLPVTPDGRYFVVRGRLWRCSNPALGAEERAALVQDLMRARRAKGVAMRAGDRAAREQARAAVHAAKVGLGERGPVWWEDGARDWNRVMVVNSPYGDWWAERGSEALPGDVRLLGRGEG